jgi:hypothetical protein
MNCNELRADIQDVQPHYEKEGSVMARKKQQIAGGCSYPEISDNYHSRKKLPYMGTKGGDSE